MLAARGKTLSEFGARAADLLGWVYLGIYHIEGAVLSKGAVWDDEYYVRVPLWSSGLSTFDGDSLTRLVLAAHAHAIRVDISPCNFQHVELMLHPRVRESNGHSYSWHPTIEQAIESAKKDELWEVGK